MKSLWYFAAVTSVFIIFESVIKNIDTTGNDVVLLVGGGLELIWWYALAWNIVFWSERLVWRKWFGTGSSGVPRQRKLLTDVYNLLVFLFITGIVLVRVFDQSATTLFATSGVLAIVIGMALQNTLGDLFSGLALNIERPFKAGDWITLDGNVQGHVLVTNWRATHIRTRTADVMVIPNGTVAKSRIINHARPTSIHLSNIEVPLDFGFNEEKLESILKQAALDVEGVLSDPAPIILLHEMTPVRTIWRVYFFVDNFAGLIITKGKVANSVYSALRKDEIGQYLPVQRFSIGVDSTHVQQKYL